jgi:hypothetical protein
MLAKKRYYNFIFFLNHVLLKSGRTQENIIGRTPSKPLNNTLPVDFIFLIFLKNFH